MTPQIKITTDALNPIPRTLTQKSHLSILPRQIQLGGKGLLLDKTRLITDPEVEKILSSREGKVLPFDSDLALSAIRGNTTSDDTIFIILPPKPLDSIYDRIAIARGMLKGQRSLEVLQVPTYSMGLKSYTQALVEFTAGENRPEIVKAFAERLLAGINTIILTKGKLPEGFTSTSPGGIKGFIAVLFGSTGLFKISKEGLVEGISKNELLSNQEDQGYELWIEYSRGGERFIQRFMKDNPGLKTQVSVLPVKPEKLSQTRQLILFHFLPTQEKINKIAAWAKHWGQLVDQ